MSTKTVEYSGPADKLLLLVRTVLSSIGLVVGTLGILFVLYGYVVQTGVSAALVPLWGLGLMLVGFGGYALVRWSRR